MIRKFLMIATVALVASTQMDARGNEATYSAFLDLKTPGNPAKQYELKVDGSQISADEALPLDIARMVTEDGDKQRISVTVTARETVWFNYGERLSTGYSHDDCLFYMPGFWYRKNLRSPEQAPSFHTSDSWLVREDRLSTPLTTVCNEASHRAVSVMRIDNFEHEALTTHAEGEIIVSGKTSIGYTGFENIAGTATVSYGFPYKEAPKTYLRKLTLAPPVEAFQRLDAGESLTLEWEVKWHDVTDFAECVQRVWEYSYDTNRPQPVATPYTDSKMKRVLSNYFVESYVDDYAIKYFASPGMHIATCANPDEAEVGFVGRVLLNAYNALEYGEAQGRKDLVDIAHNIFNSHLNHGLTSKGFFIEVSKFKRGWQETQLSIRRQSEGVYALLFYLDYEKRRGRRHLDCESKVRKMLDGFLTLQNEDGSFPRKFREDLSIVDKTGGSTPSATLPLVMAYRYFGDKRYLESAKRTVDYLDRELISKSDYFSSTLDANCEDKEASLFAATAAYYLALVSEGDLQRRYSALAKKATYFALSWYYTWDVPFASGQMLGDLNLKTRGWGNVSVENNHIDVFVFDFVDVLRWLADYYDEQRFDNFADVITTSMRQLLPCEGALCGIGKPGFYPEVVQHTNWDYGRNGKGYYNDIFAPGWTVASQWQMLTPGRAETYLKK